MPAVRIVVQRIAEAYGQRPYRLVAYGDGRNYGMVEFDSLFALREAIRHAIPSAAELIPTIENLQAGIIFSKTVEVTDVQFLALLGL